LATQSEADAQFHAKVFPAELEEIRRRRKENDLPHESLTGLPSTSLGLIGLALSGGGIRSATYSLGVLQTLARLKMLGRVDYLSTVSGGGFIGSAVSSLMNDPASKADGPDFPLIERPGIGDTPATRHLRNSQHYVAPGGMLDYIKLPAMITRGILLNFLMVIPYLMLLVIGTDVLYMVLGGPADFFTWIPIAASALFFLSAVTFPLVWRMFGARFSWTDRDRYDTLISLLFLGMLLAFVLIPFFAMVDRAVWLEPADLPTVLDNWSSAAKRWLVATGAALVLLSILMHAVPALDKWRTRVMLFSASVIGPAIILGAYLVLCVILIDPPGTNGSSAGSYGVLIEADEASLNAGLMPAALIGQTVPSHDRAPSAPVTFTAADRVEPIDHGRHWRITASDGTTFVVTDQPVLRVWYPHDNHWIHPDDRNFVLLAVAWLIFNAIFGNVNTSSAHGFWRDRISRAYLIGRKSRPGSDEPVATDAMKLTELAGPGTRAPYHILNVSLNLNGTADLDVRGRNCDFFFFSKRFSGGRRTGYIETEKLEKVHPHLNLGTAMAISGAAAAPNAGVTTESQLTFAMTMLDIRLGYWCPSPAYLTDASFIRKLQLRLGTGPMYLVREALGRVSSGGSFVNLSDGGHIENLAIIQLLRRKCRLIIAVDGEQDQAMRFDGFLRLMLYARIDLGIEIDVDLDELRKTASGLSTRHYAVATITYGMSADGTMQTGHLLYLKASLTGDEDEVMRDYHVANPMFPQESTANQFFNERQWEMYRALGAHIAEGALTGLDPQLTPIQEILRTHAPV
jgi:hypothetical protein